MLPAWKVTNIESGRQSVTVRSIVRHHSENRTLKTIWLSSIQTHPTRSKNGEEIRKPLQYVYDAGILLELLLAAPVWRADGSDTAAKAAAETLWGATP